MSLDDTLPQPEQQKKEEVGGGVSMSLDISDDKAAAEDTQEEQQELLIVEQTPVVLLIDFDKDIDVTKQVEPLLDGIGLRTVYVTEKPYNNKITVGIAVEDYKPLLNMAEDRKVVKPFIGDDDNGNHLSPEDIYFRNELPLSRYIGSDNMATFLTKTEQLQLMYSLMEEVFNKKDRPEMKGVWTLKQDDNNNKDKQQQQQPKWWGVFDTPYDNYIVPNYGTDVAQYYKLLQQYSKWLIPLAIISIFLQLCDYLITGEGYVIACIACVIISVWATFFVESWKRLLATCRFNWHALQCEDESTLIDNNNTEVEEETAPSNDIYIRAAISMLGFGIMFAITISIIIALLLLQDLSEEVSDSIIIQSLPTIAWVIVLSGGWQKAYYKLADYLTNKEKHKFRVARFESLSLKLVLFQLCNYLGWFYYVAFYRRDINYLKNQLLIFMTVKQVFGNFQELGLPMIMHYLSSAHHYHNDNNDNIIVDIAMLHSDDVYMETHHKDDKGRRDHPTLEDDINKQRTEEEYNLFDDWFEMIVDFAICVCFGAVYPIVIPLSLIHTLTEAYNDSYKLQKVMRGIVNTDEMQMQTTRTWIDTLEIISILGVITNVCLLYIQFTNDNANIVDNNNNNTTCSTSLWICVIIEHALIALKLYLSWSIPDIPEDIAIKESKRNKTPIVKDPTIQEMSIPNEVPAILITGNKLH